MSSSSSFRSGNDGYGLAICHGPRPLLARCAAMPAFDNTAPGSHQSAARTLGARFRRDGCAAASVGRRQDAGSAALCLRRTWNNFLAPLGHRAVQLGLQLADRQAYHRAVLNAGILDGLPDGPPRRRYHLTSSYIILRHTSLPIVSHLDKLFCNVRHSLLGSMIGRLRASWPQRSGAAYGQTRDHLE